MDVLRICAAALATSLGFAASTAQVPPCAADKTLEANKVFAATVANTYFNLRNASAVDEFMATTYLQHNPTIGDGTDGLKTFIGMLGEDSKFELSAQVAEDDLVWTYGRYTGLPGLPTTIAIDIFRVKDGKAVEHWDILQTEVPAAETASGRPMFPIQSDAPCESAEVLTANKKLVADALDTFFNKRDVSAVDTYIGAEYLQHNPSVRDGAESVKAFIRTFDSNGKFELGTQATEGDLVWTHGRYTGIPGSPVMVVVDIFRVKDGKLVEHWGVAQPDVPAAQTASGRPMFPIEA